LLTAERIWKDRFKGKMMPNLRQNNSVGYLIVSLMAISIFLTNVSHSGLWYPDAPSHALNGVFYKDMIEEGGGLHPRSYAERYYVQYPSLTIGIYPPVFYTIEGVLFRLFGVSPLVAKFTILLFTLLGVNTFFVLCRIWFPLGLSLVGCILYLLQPATLFGQKNVMLEMPALAMSLIALYYLYVGLERDNSYALFLTPLFMALAFLTKQSTIFLLPIWIGWIILSKKWHIFKSRQFMLGVLIGTIILVPWITVNLTISRFYVGGAAFTYDVRANLLYYFGQSSKIVSYPVIILSILSVVLFIKSRNRNGYRFALLWAGSVLLCVLLYDRRLVSAEPRQAMFIIPALIMLCMHVIWFFKERVILCFQHKSVYPILLIVLICLHINPYTVSGDRDIQGFDQVADFVVSDQDCVSVLYDGYFNSNFVFHMRARDKSRRVFVFRANKVIYSTRWLLSLGYNELINETEQFDKLLKRYSIKYIVQEEKDWTNTSANRRLRQWIRRPEFKLVQQFSVSSIGFNGPRSLLVYEYLDYEPNPIRQVVLDMPVMGREIIVRLQADK
jgi:hypothetical protein